MKRADLGIGGISLTYDRALAVPYLYPHIISDVTFVTPAPKTTPNFYLAFKVINMEFDCKKQGPSLFLTLFFQLCLGSLWHLTCGWGFCSRCWPVHSTTFCTIECTGRQTMSRYSGSACTPCFDSNAAQMARKQVRSTRGCSSGVSLPSCSPLAMLDVYVRSSQFRSK